MRLLELVGPELHNGSWDTFFRRIGGQLPNLEKVQLRGEFLTDTGKICFADYGYNPLQDEDEEDLVYHIDDEDGLQKGLFTRAMEAFIIEGGEDFPDADEWDAAIDGSDTD